MPGKTRVLNRADGVDCHYCIAREIEENGRVYEFWNKGKWCSAAEVFTDIPSLLEGLLRVIDSMCAKLT
jgi:hypothetical protein